MLLLTVGIVSCENQSNNEISNSGVYTYKDNSTELKITFSCNGWGKQLLFSDLGAEYDNQNAQYNNGNMNSNNLYESSGNFKIRYMDGS